MNSLSLGDNSDTLVAGQSSGHISVFKIGPNNASAKDFIFEKVKEVKILEKNISKVVRTTRNDFALGTESGVVFCTFRPAHSYNIVLTGEPEYCKGKDITELSEYALD